MRSFLVLATLVLAGCVAPTDPAPASNLLDSVTLLFRDIVTVGDQGNEPVLRVAPDGTIYVAALHYVYVSTDGGATFKEADFKGAIPVYASDTALAISPLGRAYVTFDWPYAGHTAVCATDDRGATWDCSPLVVPGVTDRMWIVAPTDDDVYVITGQTLNRPTFATSHDRGATWSITSFEPMDTAQGADLAWDPVEKVIVQAAASPDGWGIRTFLPDGSFAGFEPAGIPALERATLAVDTEGGFWATTCARGVDDPCEPAAATSGDRGTTWTTIDLPFEGKLHQLSFVAAGTPGRVALAWYESSAAAPTDPAAEWRFVVASSTDGATFTRTVLTPEPVRVGAMCSAVTCLGEGRYAGDFVGLGFDSLGNLHASWVRQTDAKLLPTGQQPRPLPPWVAIEYARTG